MTEKMSSPTPPPPSPTSPDPGDWVNMSKLQFFPEQHQHKPTTKTFVQGQHARIQEFLSGRGGVQAPQLILPFTEGVQWFYYTFSRGGPTFSRGGVQLLISIETHFTITCDFPGGGGVWTPYPLSIPSGSAHGKCGILARISSDEPVRPPFKLRIFKC